MSDRLKHELVTLFGRGRVEQAERTDVADLDLTAERMDAVHDAADAILKRLGQPSRQREIVDSLTNDTALVLCMWLMDTGFADTVYGAAA